MKLISQTTLAKNVRGKNILIDTNIIVYLTDDIQPYATLSRRLFEMIESGEVFAYFSIITIAEVMQGPMRKGLTKNALEIRDYLLNFPNTACQEITVAVIEKVGGVEQIDWARLRTADSLIIASGLVNNVDRIVSDDEHFHHAIPRNLIISFNL
jgi:predicted nucleic acid-binding protein